MKNISCFIISLVLLSSCGKNNNVISPAGNAASPVTPDATRKPNHHTITIQYADSPYDSSRHRDWYFSCYDNTNHKAIYDTLRVNTAYNFTAEVGHHYTVNTHTCDMGPSFFYLLAVDATTNDTLKTLEVDACISAEGYQGDWQQDIFIK